MPLVKELDVLLIYLFFFIIFQYETHLDALEKKIALAQERALEQAETDSLGTSLGPDDDANYTYAEPEQDHPDHHLGSPSDHLTGYSGTPPLFILKINNECGLIIILISIKKM